MGGNANLKTGFVDGLKKFTKKWEFVLLLILLAEFVIFGAANFEKFFRITSIFSSITNFISICIISLFVTFVMITGGIDIQAGSIVGLTSIMVGVLWNDAGLNIFLACAIALTAGMLCGALSGFFVAYTGVQPMVVTLGGSFLYSGLALAVTNMSATEAYQASAIFRMRSGRCPAPSCLISSPCSLSSFWGW